MVAKSRRQREKEARRRAILDAAERLIAERGLWATTMEDVATEAELSKGTLYLYFDTRDALCAAIAERKMGEAAPQLEQALADAPTGLDKIRAALEFHCETFRKNPHLLRMASTWMLAGIQCAPDAPDLVEYRQRLGRLMGLVVQAIEDGQRDGTVRDDVDPRLLAVQLYAGLTGTLQFQLNRDDMVRRLPFELDADALVPLYIDNAVRAIRGPAAAAERPSPRSTPPVKEAKA